MISDPAFEHLVERLHTLGPRPVAEFIHQVAAGRLNDPAMRERLAEYIRRLEPLKEFLGANNICRFPARPPLMVPPSGGDAA